MQMSNMWCVNLHIKGLPVHLTLSQYIGYYRALLCQHMDIVSAFPDHGVKHHCHQCGSN